MRATANYRIESNKVTTTRTDSLPGDTPSPRELSPLPTVGENGVHNGNGVQNGNGTENTDSTNGVAHEVAAE